MMEFEGRDSLLQKLAKRLPVLPTGTAASPAAQVRESVFGEKQEDKRMRQARQQAQDAVRPRT